MAAARRVNWFAIGVSIAVVVLLVAISAVVVYTNNTAEEAEPTVAPSAPSINAETGAIVFGTGEQTLDTYIDFMCPICNSFEQLYGDSIDELVADGTITLNVHPISILNRLSNGTNYSTRAANAMYCVAATQPDQAMAFMKAMFANQPAENSDGLSDEEILQVATSAGVSGIDACLSGGEYSGYVESMTEKTPLAPGATSIGTPTVAVNGAPIALGSLPDPTGLRSLFG